MTLNDLGLVADAVDNNAEATERYRAALGILERSLGAKHPRVAIAAANLGYSLKAGKHPAQAMEMFHRALAIYEEKMGHDYSEMLDPILGIGESLVALGRAREAQPWLERAIRLGEKSEVQTPTLAEARFTLADALWQSGGDRKHALELARSARAVYAADDTGLGKRALPEIDAWFKTHH
jgi:tetratricopeptide (TPR) repeat protein